MSNKPSGKLEQALAEADEIEAAERTTAPDVPLPAHVKVSQPGRARSKVLQVRLNPEEMAALETIAEHRQLPVSTVAREQILRLLSEEQTDRRLSPRLVMYAPEQKRIDRETVDAVIRAMHTRDRISA